LKLLIADDNESDRLILKTLLIQQGHEVICAENGAAAVTAFETHQPDVVLLDALMPVMDGFEAARTIKEMSPDRLTPVIFITSLTDAASLVDCLNSGGDDFVSKPYNRIILQAKIQAHARLAHLNSMVQEQRDKIALHHEHLLREQAVAKAVFDNIAHNGCIHAPNIKYLLSSMAVFNGDMVLVARKPSEGMFVMLGDFTGHGLPAAIGAMPASEIFYGMTKKGFTMEEIVREINLKLKNILPVGVFCCACMIDISYHEQLVKIWMGGLPDLIVKRFSTGALEFIGSQHLPLGVLSDERFSTRAEVIHMVPGDRLYLWSDGIHEAVNDKGEMFGKTALMDVFEGNRDSDDLFEDIIKGVQKFTGSAEQDDDHTIVEVTMVGPEEIEPAPESALNQVESSMPMDCRFVCELRADAFRSFNPLAFLTHFFREIPGLREHSGKLYTIMSELYANALEHGLLGLSSSLKENRNGFAEYYRLRDEKLSKLEEGQITIILTCEPRPTGGLLKIRFEDTGKGFDFDKALKAVRQRVDSQEYCGRGIPLLLFLCDDLQYYGAGNVAEVQFCWGEKLLAEAS